MEPVAVAARPEPNHAVQALPPQQPPQGERLLETMTTNEPARRRHADGPCRAVDSVCLRLESGDHPFSADGRKPGERGVQAPKAAHLERRGANRSATPAHG